MKTFWYSFTESCDKSFEIDDVQCKNETLLRDALEWIAYREIFCIGFVVFGGLLNWDDYPLNTLSLHSFLQLIFTEHAAM